MNKRLRFVVIALQERGKMFLMHSERSAVSAAIWCAKVLATVCVVLPNTLGSILRTGGSCEREVRANEQRHVWFMQSGRFVRSIIVSATVHEQAYARFPLSIPVPDNVVSISYGFRRSWRLSVRRT